MAPFFPAPHLSDRGSSPRPPPLALGRGRGSLPPPRLKPPARRGGAGRGVLTSALTSASSAAAPRPRKPRSTRSSGSSCGRAAASRPPRSLPTQPGRPGALGSLPMLSAPSPAGRATRRARPLAGAGAPHAARKLATLPGSLLGGRAADLSVLVPARAA